MWVGSTNNKGYGTFSGGGSYDGKNHRQVFAHRFAYEHFIGPIPEGLTIHHRCGVTLCVNPDHLEALTLEKNARIGRPKNVVWPVIEPPPTLF